MKLKNIFILFFLAGCSLTKHPAAFASAYPTQAPVYPMDLVISDPDKIGIPRAQYDEIVKDKIFSKDEQKALYILYYEPSPIAFMGSATHFGNRDAAVATLWSYGEYLREEMTRGWPLEASGVYGYHDELLDELRDFHFIYSNNKDRTDVLLDGRNSPLYTYFADQKQDENGQPVPYSYNDLNENQKRIYDLTDRSLYSWYKDFMSTIEEQSLLGPQKSLDSGKYIGIIATKSVNDLGRRYLLYKDGDFLGVVLVGDYAKRGDWVGDKSMTNVNFRRFPLGIRVQNDQQWGFDLTTDLYHLFGGTVGPAFGVTVVDPDKCGCIIE